jgi:hypothetical protein
LSVRKPSSSVQDWKDCPTSGRGSAAEFSSSTRRHARQNRSVCDAVADSAKSRRAASQSGAAMRVSARTLA